MAYDILIPSVIKEKFKDIKLRYSWFPEQLKTTLESLMNNPEVGSLEFFRGYDCQGILIAQFMLYYFFEDNKIKLLDIREVMYTW